MTTTSRLGRSSWHCQWRLLARGGDDINVEEEQLEQEQPVVEFSPEMEQAV